MTHPDASAWHEAGHALAAWMLGAEVRFVTLESEHDEHQGHVDIGWPHEPDQEARARRSAIVAIAGPMAELVFRGEDDLEDPDVLSTWKYDWSAFERAVTFLAKGSSRLERAREIVASVREEFADPDTRERLARVADMLAAHGSLDETLFDDAVR